MISYKVRVVVASLLLVGSVASANWVATGKIDGSPHDLGGTANSGTVGTDDNGEVCVYCHTPHAANTAFDGAPLWNKASGTAAGTVSYKMYGAADDTDTMSTIATPTTTISEPASPSLACLSCHDGVSAIDSIVNAPGSGAGSLSAGAGGQTLSELTLTNALANIGDTNATANNFMVDLSNDHPVSIPYTAGKASLRATTANLVSDVSTSTFGAWIGATTVEDLLRSGNVECGSCHDPHVGYSPNQDGPQVNFLRYSNENSALCFGCHDK